MSKRQLYFVIAVLSVALLYMLFKPAPSVAPVAVDEVQDATGSTTTPPVQSQASTDAQAVTDEYEAVTIEGVFVGLSEDANLPFSDTFEYLLLDDGTEIVRIDLRPLIGYDKVDIAARLGVERGGRVRVDGTLADDGTFTVAAITPIDS